MRTRSVAYEANPKRGTVLSMTVTGGRQGRISDFARYQLSAANKKSRPYYMRAAVTNVGTGDLSRLGVPLYGVDASNTLIPPATFNNTFVPCPSTPFPQGFTSTKKLAGCLVYLVPNGGTLKAVSYRPSQKYAGITWSGTILPPAPDKAAAEEGRRQGEGQEEGTELTHATDVRPTTLRLGSLEVATPVVLAPMAGITNAAYRRLCSEQGAGLYVCEMITSRGLVEGDATTRQMLVFDEQESVRSVQLYGTDPTYVGRATEILCTEYGVAHVDLNFGCPVPKVTRKGGGAALPWKRTLLGEILTAAVAAASRHDVPVTMKTRKGIDEDHLTYLDAGRIAEQSGVAAIALHGRTAIQGYSGVADWDAISRLVEHVDIPVLGNGDIWEASDALRMVEQTGADGVVVGRGCLGRPWLFRDLADAFARSGG